MARTKVRCAEASASIPNVERLIYIAASVPNVGESHSDCARLVKVRTAMDKAIKVEGPLLLLDPKLAPLALYQECTPEDRAWAAAQLSTQTLASFRSPRSSFDVEAPSYYVRCTFDNAVDLSVQELMAARCNEFATLESGHSPMFSMPGALCDLIVSTA